MRAGYLMMKLPFIYLSIEVLKIKKKKNETSNEMNRRKMQHNVGLS